MNKNYLLNSLPFIDPFTIPPVPALSISFILLQLREDNTGYEKGNVQGRISERDKCSSKNKQ